MTPHFSMTEKGRWKLLIDGSPAEIEILRNHRFEHRVIFKMQYEELDIDLESDKDRWIKKQHTTTLGELNGDDGTPLKVWLTYHVFNKGDIEEWEQQVTKRLAAISKDIAALLPPEEPGSPDIPEAAWFSHTAFIAQTGRGKTNGVRWRLDQIIGEVWDGRHTVIVQEPKGTLTESVLRWTKLPRDRVVVIDPQRPLTVNLFDKGDGSPQALRDALALSTYVLSTMTAALSSFQESALTYPLRLLFATDHPTIDGLIDILRGGGQNHPALDRTPKRVQVYFEKDFKRAESSRNQLLDRLNALLADPIFEALFAGETSFDLLAAMQRGSFIVIDAREGKLGKETDLWGRFWIAQAYRAAMSRLALPEHDRMPVTFIMDEAQTFIAEDEMFAMILDKAREAKMGMFLAFHHMEQITRARVRDSIYTNTAIKFVARSSADIFNLCRSMGGTEPDFLSNLGDYEFAFFAPNLREARRVKLPLVEFEQHPRSVIRDIIEESYRRNQPPPIDITADQPRDPPDQPDNQPRKKRRWGE